jgi:hypothetical protein
MTLMMNLAAVETTVARRMRNSKPKRIIIEGPLAMVTTAAR